MSEADRIERLFKKLSLFPLQEEVSKLANDCTNTIYDLERQLAEAREFKCPKCKEVLIPYIDEDEFHGDRLAWFCACEPRDLPILEKQLKEKGENEV